jgi:DNA modification methylase
MGMADFVLTFRKWAPDLPDHLITHPPIAGDYIGDNPPTSWDSDRDWSIQLWQKYASPVWFDIRQTNVLQYAGAREEADERHICPLQLDVIERLVWLYSNPGELVFDPFCGVGSTPHVALKMGRRGLGCELKRSYWEQSKVNLSEVSRSLKQRSLFEVSA